MSSLPTWILWLGATLLPLGALWGLWQLALRPERGYGYNRALLMLAPALAAALPLLPRPALPGWPGWLAEGGPAGATAVGPLLVAVGPVAPAATAAANWPGWAWLLGLYLAGVAVGLGRLAWQAGRLHWLAARLPRFAQPGYVLVHTGGQLPTSAFGRVVFWDETAALTPAEARAVLAHELAHVGQSHTRDVLWLRLWQAALWPNPFVHLLLPALRLTHELLADQAAAAETGPGAYAPVLAGLAARRFAGPASTALLHPFTFSSTLIRLAMLRNAAPVRRWKQWLPLPLLVAATCLVGRPATAQTTPPQASPPPPPTVSPNAKSTPGAKPAVYTYVEQMPQLPGGGGQQAILDAILKNLVYPAGSRKEGQVYASFIVRADGSVTDRKITKSLSDPCDQAALEAIAKLPRFTPGRQNGVAVPVSFTVPITFVVKP